MGSAIQAQLRAARVLMKDEYESCRELSFAMTKLDECLMWLECAPLKAVPKAGAVLVSFKEKERK